MTKPRSVKITSSLPYRAGYTLLELVMAMSLLSVITTGTSLALRNSRQAWESFESDHTRVRTLHALVRQIVRSAREGASVVAVTAPDRTPGSLTIRLQNGNELTWQHDVARRQVVLRQTQPAASSVVAENIVKLRFEARNADMRAYQSGSTDRIQHVWIEASVDLPGTSPSRRTITGAVWIRPFGRNRPE